MLPVSSAPCGTQNGANPGADAPEAMRLLLERLVADAAALFCQRAVDMLKNNPKMGVQSRKHKKVPQERTFCNRK
jgi:hypothetical protein